MSTRHVKLGRRGAYVLLAISLLVVLVGIGRWVTRGGSRPAKIPLSPSASRVPTRRLISVSTRRMVFPYVAGQARPYISPGRLTVPNLGTARVGGVPVGYRGDRYGISPLPHIITYTVHSGDTMSAIALRYKISLDSLRWSNPTVGYNPDDLYIGQKLRIPPVDGVVVMIKKGDTIERLARRYHVSPESIRSYAPNHLRPPYHLQPGTLLTIPGGRLSIHLSPPSPHPGYAYMWPVRGIITQHYSEHHRGLDIATVYEAGVYAARSGRVRVARWDTTGYGNMIIIDHGNGWNTLYAHLKGFLVRPGQWVHQGDLIARVGGTGRATGPHVHFEIRKGRVRYDPQKFLPPSP